MSERDLYPNLPADVSIMHCTSANPMPLEIANIVKDLKQLWIHDDAKETEESQEFGESTVWFYCKNCKHTYSCYLGD